jgi:hypothetical protein
MAVAVALRVMRGKKGDIGVVVYLTVLVPPAATTVKSVAAMLKPAAWLLTSCWGSQPRTAEQMADCCARTFTSLSADFARMQSRHMDTIQQRKVRKSAASNKILPRCPGRIWDARNMGF